MATVVRQAPTQIGRALSQGNQLAETPFLEMSCPPQAWQFARAALSKNFCGILNKTEGVDRCKN